MRGKTAEALTTVILEKCSNLQVMVFRLKTVEGKHNENASVM